MLTCAQCRYYVPSPGWRYVSDPNYAEVLKNTGQCAITLPSDDNDPETDAREVVRSFSRACKFFQAKEDKCLI